VHLLGEEHGPAESAALHRLDAHRGQIGEVLHLQALQILQRQHTQGLGQLCAHSSEAAAWAQAGAQSANDSSRGAARDHPAPQRTIQAWQNWLLPAAIEAPWLVNGGHGASLRQHYEAASLGGGGSWRCMAEVGRGTRVVAMMAMQPRDSVRWEWQREWLAGWSTGAGEKALAHQRREPADLQRRERCHEAGGPHVHRATHHHPLQQGWRTGRGA
jgi:hypothetical protein